MKFIIFCGMGFKENLKEQLSYSGMYVKELAALSGVKKQTIDSYLKTDNSPVPSADAAVAIARALGVSVEYLVLGQRIQQGSDLLPSTLPAESRMAAQIIAQLDEKNRKMALTIVKAMKKQEDEVKRRQLN